MNLLQLVIVCIIVFLVCVIAGGLVGYSGIGALIGLIIDLAIIYSNRNALNAP